jgi:hypothetical protein
MHQIPTSVSIDQIFLMFCIYFSHRAIPLGRFSFFCLIRHVRRAGNARRQDCSAQRCTTPPCAATAAESPLPADERLFLQSL